MFETVFFLSYSLIIIIFFFIYLFIMASCVCSFLNKKNAEIISKNNWLFYNNHYFCAHNIYSSSVYAQPKQHILNRKCLTYIINILCVFISPAYSFNIASLWYLSIIYSIIGIKCKLKFSKSYWCRPTGEFKICLCAVWTEFLSFAKCAKATNTQHK